MLYEGEAMVMDFGIAKAVSAADSETLTQTGMMIGTPAYVSPEQAAGETNLDGRSDQYSLACMIYEMLSGERPFSGSNAQAIMAKRFTETARPLRAVRAAVPESIERAVAKAMSTDPSGRYTTTAQFAQALSSTSLSTPNDTMVLPPAPVSAAKSVAVLPFANMSADQDNEYFTDGMAEEIINALSKIQSLARDVAHLFVRLQGQERGHRRDRKETQGLDGARRQRPEGGQPAAHHRTAGERGRRIPALVGALRPRDGRRVRDPGRHLAGDRQGAAGHPERGREEADREAARRQRRGVRFLPARAPGIPRSGARCSSRPDRCSRRQSRSTPSYARAYAGLADCLSLSYTYFDTRESNLREAEIASSRALELEPELAEAHVARGLAVSLSKRFDEAEKEFEQAMHLDPKLFDAVVLVRPCPTVARPVRGRAQAVRARRGAAARGIPDSRLHRPGAEDRLVVTDEADCGAAQGQRS